MRFGLLSSQPNVARFFYGSISVWLGFLAPCCPVSAFEAPARAHVRFVTGSLVAPGKFNKLAQLAEQFRIKVDHISVGSNGEARQWASSPDLVVFDTVSPWDYAPLKTELSQTRTPWVRVGGGPPEFGNIPPLHARRLVAHYGIGGAPNLKQMFGYFGAWRAGESVAGFLSPTPFPAAGIYHPAAPGPFATADAFLAWGQGRWKGDAPRIAIAVHLELISDMETGFIDSLIERSERRGMIPIVFWFDAANPEGLRKFVRPAQADVLVISNCGRNGPARSADLFGFNIPVIEIGGLGEGEVDCCIQPCSRMQS
jgi:cobaltochelatase CobN